MSTASSNSKGFGKIGYGIFAFVLAGAMLLLSVTLYRECSAGSDTLDAYVSAVRRGTDVSADVAGGEAADLTALLRASSSIAVDNFQSQAETSCYWVTIEHDGRETKVAFVLQKQESGMAVIAGSITRGCDCPDPDFDKRCHLK